MTEAELIQSATDSLVLYEDQGYVFKLLIFRNEDEIFTYSTNNNQQIHFGHFNNTEQLNLDNYRISLSVIDQENFFASVREDMETRFARLTGIEIHLITELIDN